ncbi:MAG: metallophosphoesterase [Treponema sp.]|jgi:hypothetical protein|nr:metallophosphoesterase [Treponema sp.]
MRRSSRLIAALVILAACTGCKSGLRYNNTGDTTGYPYPDSFFAVISDIHIYDPSLGSSGAAFEEILMSDRKLLLDSQDLLDCAIDSIILSGAGFVLVSGDLTKDGELVNHTIAAEKLKRLLDANIKVYVVPGNHDINNPDAVRFLGDKTEPVATVSAGDFERIYGDFGFNAALMRDSGSLSYVTEPAEGLWLLAIDACRYRENKPGKHEIVSGKISRNTADWIAGVLQEAADRNKAVMVLMHHGVVEHWNGQARLHPNYIVKDYAKFAGFLASWNVRLCFTGHYHAQDITRSGVDGKFIYDVETGSLVTAPCPVRFAEIKNNAINIRTETIVDRLYPGTDFAANAHAFVKRTVMLETEGILKMLLVSGKDTEIISNAVGDAFTAHYSGDENPALRPPLDKSLLGVWGRFVLNVQQYVLDGLWDDLPPADNNVSLQL